MSLGLYLLAAHLTGDFLFQPNWMAKRKIDEPFVRLVHVIFYTIPFVPIIVLGTSWPLGQTLLLIATTHYITDSERWVEPKDDFESWPYIFDQVLHIVQIALLTALFNYAY